MPDLRRALLTTVCVLIIAAPAVAQTTWLGGQTTPAPPPYLWSNAANWSNGVPGTTSSDVLFADPAASATSLATTNDLGALALNGIAVNASAAGPVSIAGNGFTLNGPIGIDLAAGSLSSQLTVGLNAGQSIVLGGAQQWRLFVQATAGTTTQTLTISSPITGPVGADLTYGVTNNSTGASTSGTVQILGVNTYAGNTTIGGPNYTYVVGTSTVVSGGNIVSGPFGTGTITNSSFNTAPRWQTAGAITIDNAINWGSGFMYTAASTGSLTFNGPSTLIGNTAGQVNRTMNIVAGLPVVFNGSITMAAAGDTLAKNLLFQPTSPGSITVNGVIQDAVTGAVGTLTKAGTGVLTLNNSANTFGGQVALQNGTTEITLLADQNSPSSLGTGSTAAPINIGTGATAATLRYIGSSNSSTNRQLRMLGTTGGTTLENNGTGTVSYTSPTWGTAGAGIKTLTLTGSNTGLNTIAGAINQNSATNTTSVSKTGDGTWNLTGANSYTGTTQVNAGILLINNPTGIAATAGPVTVVGATTGGGQFGTLGGAGGIGPAVTVQAGTGGGSNAVIAPGAATGVSVGTLSLGGGLNLPGTYVADVLTGPDANDLIAVAGNLDLTGGTLSLPATNTYAPVANNVTYTLMTYSGALTGAFATVLNQPPGYQVVYTAPGQVNLSPTPVPEPVFALAACGVCAAFARWRRKTPRP